MAKVKRRSYYDLNKSFRDAQGNLYQPNDGERDLLTSTLRLWVRMNQTTPVDLGPNSLSPAYNNSPQTHRHTIGNKNYYAATFSDAAATKIEVTSTSGLLDFSTAASGGTPSSSTDTPFSISLWAKFDNLDGVQILFAKEVSSDYSYKAWVSSSGAVVFTLLDVSGSSAWEQISSSSSVFVPGVWYHLVFTYDGTGGASAVNGMEIYKDGALLSTSDGDSGTYRGMNPVHGNSLNIGGSEGVESEMDGLMAEFAVWSKELTAEEVAAIYNVTRADSVEEISGFINNPPRTVLRDQDNLPGAYPPVLRTGDHDFMGKGLQPFDDTNSIDFVSSYATAEIIFKEPVDEGGIYIALTGSVRGQREQKEHFEFFPGEAGPSAKFKYTSGSIVPAQGFSVRHVVLSGSLSRRKQAYLFAQEINAANMGIEAKNFGNKVMLRQHMPATGSYNVHNNRIHSGSIKNFVLLPGEPFQVKQFTLTADGSYKLLYPYVLESGYKNIAARLDTPNTNTTLETYGISKRGIADAGLSFTDYSTEAISPFDESRINIADNAFSRIGTPRTILDGFSAPLRSKTHLVFNLNSDTNVDNGLGTHIFFATSSNMPHATLGGGIVPSAGSDVKDHQHWYHSQMAYMTGSSMAYWNSVRSAWEMLEPLDVDVHHGSGSIRVQACLGFSPSDGNRPFNYKGIKGAVPALAPRPRVRDESGHHVPGFLDMAATVGHPIKEFGFPVAKQYNATGSQCISMSDYITSPFLLEKIILELNGNFGLNEQDAGGTAMGDQPLQKQFFILNQMTDGDRPHYDHFRYPLRHVTQSAEETAATAEPLTLVKKGIRELVGYAKISFLRNDNDQLPFLLRPQNSVYLKDVFDHLELAPPAAFSSAFGVTASMRVEFEPSISTYSAGIAEHTIRPSPIVPEALDPPHSTHEHVPNIGGLPKHLTLTNDGGADGLGGFSGRQLGSSFINTKTSWVSGTDTGNSVYFRQSSRKHSPYLLMPEDRLIFGWQNRPFTIYPNDFISHGDGPRTERQMATKIVDRLSKVKVTLIGSMISDGKETHDHLNQPLTTNAVHEAIGMDKVTDQFNVSPTAMLSGSYSDALMSGSMFGGPVGTAAAAHNGIGCIGRQRQGSIVSQNSLRLSTGDSHPWRSNTTGSLQRFAQFFNDRYIYKDSAPIRVASVVYGHALPLITATVSGTVRSILPMITPAVRGSLPGTITIGSTTGISAADVGKYDVFSSKPQFGLIDERFTGGSTKPTNSPEFKAAGNIKKIQMQDIAQHITAIPKLDALSAMAFGAAPSNGFAPGVFSDPTQLPGGKSVFDPAFGPVLIAKIGVDGSSTLLKGSITDRNMGYTNRQAEPMSSMAPASLLSNPRLLANITNCFERLRDSGTRAWSAGVRNRAVHAFFKPAGFKYGYSAAHPQPLKNHFRRDHFGAFRDMLEQGPESALVAASSRDNEPAPVRVEFVSRGGVKGVDPLSTNSQNLSLFATSSMPYDDGKVVDRITPMPDMEDVITIASEVSAIIEEGA